MPPVALQVFIGQADRKLKMPSALESREMTGAAKIPYNGPHEDLLQNRSEEQCGWMYARKTVNGCRLSVAP